MTASPSSPAARVPLRAESLLAAGGAALVDLGREDPAIRVVAPGTSTGGLVGPFAESFPDRAPRSGPGPADLLARAAQEAAGGGPVFVELDAVDAVGEAYRSIRDAIAVRRARVVVLAVHAGFSEGGTVPGAVEDLGVMRGLPGMAVVVPADAPTTRSAVRALARWAGPAYLRLTRRDLPTVTDGTFALGRAVERHPGSDLTIVAAGGPVARALDTAREFAAVGVSVRVLDFASIKPFDEPALLRAARDTGAILVLEEHSVLTGLGALVAAATSENYPVPVRRLGIPDLFVASEPPDAPLDRYGLSAEHVRDETWELLRIRGKVQ